MDLKRIRTIIIALILVIATIITIYIVTSEESLDIRDEATGDDVITVCFDGGADCDFDYGGGNDKQAIKKAVESAPDEAIILIKEGYYRLDYLDSVYGGTFITPILTPIGTSNKITIRGEGMNKTVLIGIKDMPGDRYWDGAIIAAVGSENFYLEDLSIISKGEDVSGIRARQSNIYISNVHLGPSSFMGIVIDEDSKAEIHNNIITECSWFGLYVDHGANSDIQNNLFFDNQIDAISIWPNSKAQILNNTIVGNNSDPTGNGAISMMRNSTVEIKNNIVVNNHEYGITNDVGRSWSAEYTTDYNNFYGNEAGNYKDVEPGEHSISEEPDFEETDQNYLYLLTDNSTSVDSGDPEIEDPSSNSQDADYPAKGGVISDLGAYGGPYASEWKYYPYSPPPEICESDSECDPGCEGVKKIGYGCIDSECIYEGREKCSLACGAECTTRSVIETQCNEGYTCNLNTCECEMDIPISCFKDKDCKTPCEDNKRLSYSCLKIGLEGWCQLGDEPTCDEECGAECTKDEDCNSGTCDTDSCSCTGAPQPPPEPPSKCSEADIWGSGGKSDGKINAHDLSLMLMNWKCTNGINCDKADIWGKEQKKDGKVNGFDISRLLSCWKKI